MNNTYLSDLFSLEGKTAVITGAAGGIGSAIAIGLAKAGAFVVLCDINTQALAEIQKEAGEKSKIYPLDMTAVERFDEAVKDIVGICGRIDVLVNCAGINKREGLVDVEEATYDKIMDINLKGAFFFAQAIAPVMKAQNGGTVINIGSHNTGPVLGGVSVYAASKSGLWALTKSMAVEWAKYNIRANCISPGHIQTELTTPTWEHPERSKYLLDRIALGRPGTPEDIVGCTIFLASDAAAYITGCEYRIDGGCVCGGTPWPYDTNF